MKLYTEEQVKILLNALTDIKNWNEELEDEWEDCGYRAIDALNNFSDVNEIELPSDEEMGVIALNIASTLKDGLDSREEAFYLAGFQTCAKWMKEQILNQNK